MLYPRQTLKNVLKEIHMSLLSRIVVQTIIINKGNCK